jgi:C4-dicarboxylate-specific signal transduction histidine kinase
VVTRDFQDVPPILIEKHKVLQILVNLIRNATYACTASDHPRKELTIQVREDDGFVEIAVIDNGVGIAREDLTRIFVHGFTTKKEGHGFGLHSGAIAAKEMGGSLQVQSEGLGRGATFTLRLPMHADKRMKGPQADRIVGMHGAVSERMSA